MSNVSIPNNLSTITLINKNVSEQLKKFNETEIFFHGTLHTMGFNKLGVSIEKKHKGNTEYSFKKKINLFIDAITSFSSHPLKFFFYTGLIISSLSFISILFILYIKIFKNQITVDGYTSLLVIISFFGGVVMSGIGVLGIYISKIFDEVKKRPQTIIKKIY